MRHRAFWRAFRFFNRFIVTSEAVEQPYLAGDKPIVLSGEQLFSYRNLIESGFRGGVVAERSFILIVRNGGIAGGDRTGPPRVGECGDARKENQYHEARHHSFEPGAH